MTSYSSQTQAARAYLERHLDRALAPLGALLYETVDDVRALRRGNALAAAAVVVARDPNVPGSRPTVMLDALDAAALDALVRAGGWPARATWSVAQAELLPQLEAFLDRPHDPALGDVSFVARLAPASPHGPVRQLGVDDVDLLDLAPCALSSSALRFWLLRGWRVFGFVRGGALLGHALAAYPIGNTEEVAAVFTAPAARGQGVGSAVVAAAAADICDRGRRAVYVTRKTNHASRRVALKLGLAPLAETWEIVT